MPHHPVMAASFKVLPAVYTLHQFNKFWVIKRSTSTAMTTRGFYPDRAVAMTETQVSRWMSAERLTRSLDIRGVKSYSTVIAAFCVSRTRAPYFCLALCGSPARTARFIGGVHGICRNVHEVKHLVCTAWMRTLHPFYVFMSDPTHDSSRNYGL